MDCDPDFLQARAVHGLGGICCFSSTIIPPGSSALKTHFVPLTLGVW